MKITDNAKAVTDFSYKWIAIGGVIIALGLGAYNHFATREKLEKYELKSMERDQKGIIRSKQSIERDIKESEVTRDHYQNKQDGGHSLEPDEVRRKNITRSMLTSLYDDLDDTESDIEDGKDAITDKKKLIEEIE